MLYVKLLTIPPNAMVNARTIGELIVQSNLSMDEGDEITLMAVGEGWQSLIWGIITEVTRTAAQVLVDTDSYRVVKCPEVLFNGTDYVYEDVQ